MFNRLLFIFIIFASANCGAAPRTKDTTSIFANVKGKVVQIRILDNTTHSRSSLGSGFIVSKDGFIITNYHVVADMVHKPTQYQAEFVRHDATSGALELLNIDVVHDLAIVKMTDQSNQFFKLQRGKLRQGERVFSIGIPLDIGFTIVEGTYNGLIANSLYEKIHFTGAINPGMSGGPAITRGGQVFGVNVASAGNQVGFLVPMKYVQKLLDETIGKPIPKNLLERARDQILANQDQYMKGLLASPLPAVHIGSYNVPGKVAKFVKCWGDTRNQRDQPFEVNYQSCSSQDDLFVSRDHSAGVINYQHYLISSRKLNRFRFFNLYESYFKRDDVDLHAGKEDVTNFKCNSDFVTQDNQNMRAVLCLRAYRKLPGLYDLVLKAATLNDNSQGMQTTLTLAGVSFDNAIQFARKYLEVMIKGQ